MTMQELKELIIQVTPIGLGRDRLLGLPPMKLKQAFDKALMAELGLGEKIPHDSPTAEKAKQYAVIGFGLDKIVVYLTTDRKGMFTATDIASTNKLQWYIYHSNNVVCDAKGITEIVY